MSHSKWILAFGCFRHVTKSALLWFIGKWCRSSAHLFVCNLLHFKNFGPLFLEVSYHSCWMEFNLWWICHQFALTWQSKISTFITKHFLRIQRIDDHYPAVFNLYSFILLETSTFTVYLTTLKHMQLFCVYLFTFFKELSLMYHKTAKCQCTLYVLK